MIEILPVVPGGNGWRPGSGPGSGGGTGGGTGPGGDRVRPAFDFELVPIRKVRPQFILGPGQVAIPTVVAVVGIVEDDGRVSSAKAVTGPDYLRENAEQSALGWAFEPLAKHGLKVPQSIRIEFRYSMADFKH